jgi:phosphoglycerate dehydrogenase-like enzyme
MMRCAILDDYQQVALQLADWSAVDAVSFSQPLESLEVLADFEVVVAMRERTPFDAAALARLPHLKLLITTGMRNASIDVAAARARGIEVCGTASYSEPPVELTWALLLGLARQLVPESQSVRHGGWQTTVGSDLHGRQLGLLGLGKIGSRVAQIGQAFGMKVAAWSQNLTAEAASAQGVEWQEKSQLLSSSHFLSLHLVLSPRTRAILGREELRLLRPDAYLINTSRSGLIDPAALQEALEQRWFAGFGVDVYDQEPLPADHYLRQLPHVLATPHLGYVTRRNYTRYYQEAVENIQAFLQGSPIRRLT